MLVEKGGNLPPVVVTYRNDQLVLEHGNHQVESLRRADRRAAAWAIVNFDADTRDWFEAPAATT